jgi:single-stranded DNA-binding protein
VQIEGEIQTREYTQKTGGKKPVDVKKSITEIRVASIMNLDRKKTDGASASDAEGAAA